MDRSASSARVLGSKTGRRAVENGDIGLLIRLVREALGWKQSDLGKEAGYSQPTISRLEKGQGRIGDLEVRARLADILEIPRSAVGLAGREPAGGGQRNLADMRRSDFLHGVLGAAASVALPIEVTNADRSRIGMATVRECASALNRLYELDERRGGATIYALATRMVSDIRTALARATYTAGVGRELRGVAALTAEHAGWLAYDSGRTEDARRWWLEALHLADLAGDSDARVTALVSMALQASTAEDPAAGREAVDLMDVARSASATLSPRLASLMRARQAIGYARIGDHGASVKAMTAAERFLHQGGSNEDEPTWLHFWGPADLSCHLARAFLALDDPARAEAAAAVAQGACDESTYPRNHTIYGAVRATALTRGGRVDEAIAAATPVVARVSTLGSRRVLAEARGVVRQLGKYQPYGPAASFTAWADKLLPAA